MRITTLLAIYAVGFLGMVAALIGLTLWNIDQSRKWEMRVTLAHSILEMHLELQTKTFQLFKQHGDALIIGDLDEGVSEAALSAEITEVLSQIRTQIGQEIQLVGEGEIEELETLAMIEAEIDDATRNLIALNAQNGAMDPNIRLERLAYILDQIVDEELTALIETAVEEEREELVETQQEAHSFRRSSRNITTFVALMAAGFLIAAIWSYSRLLHYPFTTLMKGISDYGKGDFSRNIECQGGIELNQLGEVLSDMAALLRRREIEQADQAEKLELKVKERTSELERLLKQIEMTEANRRRLMADISHELRTPLAIIRGEAEVTLRSTPHLDDTISDTFARIRDSARHTTMIVDDMLLIARHEAGELRLDPKEVDLRKVIADAQDMFSTEIAVDYRAEDTQIRADSLRMRQCLLSVLHNAQRYGGPNIVVEVDDDTNGNGVVIRVTDDGPGLSDDEKKQAFDRFFRGSNAAARTGEGTGLGLPIVRAIMEAHGGEAYLSDAENGGLCVILRLPSKPALKLVGAENHVVFSPKSVKASI